MMQSIIVFCIIFDRVSLLPQISACI